jgi:hypothetical protein
MHQPHWSLHNWQGQKGNAPSLPTMINPATGWFKISKVEDKTSAKIANLFEMLWTNHYPWPQQVVMDHGCKIMGNVISLLKNEYGINRQPITTRNSQANAMIERSHQTIHNMNPVKTDQKHGRPPQR